MVGFGAGLTLSSTVPPAVKWSVPSRHGLVVGLVVSGLALGPLWLNDTIRVTIRVHGVSWMLLVHGIVLLATIVLLSLLLENPLQGYVPPGSYAGADDRGTQPGALGRSDHSADGAHAELPVVLGEQLPAQRHERLSGAASDHPVGAEPCERVGSRGRRWRWAGRSELCSPACGMTVRVRWARGPWWPFWWPGSRAALSWRRSARRRSRPFLIAASCARGLRGRVGMHDGLLRDQERGRQLRPRLHGRSCWQPSRRAGCGVRGGR